MNSFLLFIIIQYYFEKAAKKQGIQNILALRGGRSFFTLLILNVFYYV